MKFSGMEILHNSAVGKDELEYWNNKIFSVVVFSLIICGVPLLCYGAYMFYSVGNYVQTIIEILMAVIIPLTITQKFLSVRFRKLFVVYVIYLISILLLINTGVMGGGLVCIAFSLLLAGCLLDIRQVYQIVIINVIVFAVLTVLLANGHFDGTPMESFKHVWLINVMTTQLSGVTLVFIIGT